MDSSKQIPEMDDQTALAFAGECFNKLHPRNTWPDWVLPCTVFSHHRDAERRYVVHFSVTPIATRDGVAYFEVAVNPRTGETEVLRNDDLSQFVGEELEGFDKT